MQIRYFTILLAMAAAIAIAADPPEEFKLGRDRSTNNVPRSIQTNQHSLINRFGTNDPSFTNRFRTNTPDPIAPRDRNLPPDQFPPNRIAPDRFLPDRFEPDPEKPPVVPPEFERSARPSVPPRTLGGPAPPKGLTLVPTTPSVVPVVLTVRARSSHLPLAIQNPMNKTVNPVPGGYRTVTPYLW